MRIAFAILLLGFAPMFSGQTSTEYMTAVNNELRIVQEASWQYVHATTQGKPSKAEKKRQALLFAVSLAMANLSAIPAYGSDTGLRDSAVSFLKVTQAVVNEDYSRVVDLEPIAESAYDAMEAFILARERAEHRLAAAGMMMEEEYKKFAARHKLAVSPEKNPLAEQLAAAATAYNYYNSVYAIFFRNYKQESYFLQAMNENDVSGLEQNRDALAVCAAKSIEELKSMPSFKKDEHLKNACEKLLDFYHEEAALTLSAAPQYFVDRDNMQKMKSAYESKRPEERTADDNRLYQETLGDHRKRSEEFRKRYAAAESKRQSLLKSWNKAGEHFIRRHVP